MKITKKDKLLFVVLHALLLLYIILVGLFTNDKYSLMGWNIGWVLLLMFVLELLSTLTFTLRIYYTDKSFKLAAVFGTLSWIIAGAQGLIFITGEVMDIIGNTPINQWLSFLIKIPVIGLATYGGIYFNLKYLTPAINKRNIKI